MGIGFGDLFAEGHGAQADGRDAQVAGAESDEVHGEMDDTPRAGRLRRINQAPFHTTRMPEGPSLVILREQAQVFEGRRILRVEGNTTIDKARLKGRTVQAVRTWGKHFLLELPTVALRIHLLMFGSYCIDSRKPDKPLRIGLGFAGGRELNFYS